MSNLGCRCGNTIRDGGDCLPYKASLLPDIKHHDFFEWVGDETSSFIAAVMRGGVDEWLLQKGYSEEYVDLKQNHSQIIHDHIHTKFLNISRAMYECVSCGRVIIETGKNNHFTSYNPDDGTYNRVLAFTPRPSTGGDF